MSSSQDFFPTQNLYCPLFISATKFDFNQYNEAITGSKFNTKIACIEQILKQFLNHSLATHQILASELTLNFVHVGWQDNFETSVCLINNGRTPQN